jgi:Domain of unknown function (DUF4168)
MVTSLRPILTLLAMILCWLGLNGQPAALAQPTPLIPGSILTEQSAPSRSGMDPGDIPSEKVNQFVQAYLQVVALIERREGELQGAETESESRGIEQEIEKEAIAIIATAGLTRQEYIQLLGLANNNPEFGERIALQLQEATS